MSEIKVCQCCGQRMMIYRRSIRKCMLFCLRKLFFKHGRGFLKVHDLESDGILSADFEKIRYWSLLEKGDNNTWGISDFGIDFILGRVQIPKYIFIYNQELQGEPIGEENPLIWCWDIAPQEISKESVLSEAVHYPRRNINDNQIELFNGIKS